MVRPSRQGGVNKTKMSSETSKLEQEEPPHTSPSRQIDYAVVCPIAALPRKHEKKRHLERLEVIGGA